MMLYNKYIFSLFINTVRLLPPKIVALYTPTGNVYLCILIALDIISLLNFANLMDFSKWCIFVLICIFLTVGRLNF